MSDLKHQLEMWKNTIVISAESKIKTVISGLDQIENNLNEGNKIYLEKLKHCSNLIENFEESNGSIMQWENFRTSFLNEINTLKEDYINNLINEKISALSNEKKTNNIKIAELKKELNLKCNVLMERIKALIEISKLDAKLYEDQKCVVIFTEHYYKNKDLKNFIDNKISKLNSETIGKILGLYDSSIRNRTLNVNMLELQNRIKDFSNFEDELRRLFNRKVEQLQIEIESREEFLETKTQLESLIENNTIAVKNISENLQIFISLQNLIEEHYNNLNLDLNKHYTKLQELIEKSESSLKIREIYDKYNQKLDENLKLIQERIETELKSSLNKHHDSIKLNPELREYFVKHKNNFLKVYQDKKDKVNNDLLILKNEKFREELLNSINYQKIYLSQLLGTLQKKVEDFLDFNQFKKAYFLIFKRQKNLKEELYKIDKIIRGEIKDYNKQSKDFETQNKYIIEDFTQFLKEFQIILSEKVSSLEKLILKSYVGATVKALKNEFLTISFINNELGMKRKAIQDHLIFLISEGSLGGKYDPQLMVYYENPEIFEKLDESELEVVKKMNYRVYIFLRRLKHFISNYYIIFAFFATTLSITTSVYTITGGDPISLIFPIIIIIIIIIAYLFLKREKEAKV